MPAHTITHISPVSLPSSHSSLPLSVSDWWSRQQPSALRFSRLSSPPGKKGAYIRIVLIRHCQSKRSLSSPAQCCSSARRDSWTSDSCKVCGARIMSLGGRAICPASSSLPSSHTTWQRLAHFILWQMLHTVHMCEQIDKQTYYHISTCTYATLNLCHGGNHPTSCSSLKHP